LPKISQKNKSAQQYIGQILAVFFLVCLRQSGRCYPSSGCFPIHSR